MNKKLDGKGVTKISKEKNYCKAEDYHQKYFQKKNKKMILVSTQELDNGLSSNVKLIDASWHFLSNRDGFKEYQKEHIENAIFFDLEKNSNQQKNLPHNHFLPEKKNWEKAVSKMGISNKDKLVIYDNSDLITSCRCWFQFLYFGHSPKLIFILDGGLKKWKLENRKITNKKTKTKPSKYFAKENTYMIKTKLQIEENIKKDEFKLLDARSKERFNGKVKEPRPGVRSGSIEGSMCLPYSECINPKDNSFLNKKILDEKFKALGVIDNNVVFSCGSSVTASVLGVAYSLINNKYMPIIYVGSWSEYGKK